MGRKPLGEKKLTNAEKSKRCRDRKNAEERKLKDKLRKEVARQKIYADTEKHAAQKKRRNETQRKYRKHKHEENVAKGPKEQPLLIKFNIPSISRSVKKTQKDHCQKILIRGKLL